MYDDHIDVKSWVETLLYKQIFKPFPEELLKNSNCDPQVCYCLNNESSKCWDQNFDVYTNHGIFIIWNMMFTKCFPDYPYFTKNSNQEWLNEEKEFILMELLKFDMMFNPLSYQSYIMYGTIIAYKFWSQAEAMHLKGHHIKNLESQRVEPSSAPNSNKNDSMDSDFDKIIISYANAIYIMTNILAYENSIDIKSVAGEINFIPMTENWILRHKHLHRWPDSSVINDIISLLDLLFRVVNL